MYAQDLIDCQIDFHLANQTRKIFFMVDFEEILGLSHFTVSSTFESVYFFKIACRRLHKVDFELLVN